MHLQLRPRIVPTGQSLPWRDAHNAVKAQGGLPPHVLLDRHLCNEAYQKTLSPAQRDAIDDSCPLWSGDGYAYPAVGETFQRDTDIVSAHSNWRLPWSGLIEHVSPGDIVRPQTGLFIRIQDVHADTVAGQSVTIVQPASIVVIHPAVETRDDPSKVHEPTGMVLEVSPEEFAKLPEDQKRLLWRFKEMFVGPLVRDVGDVLNWRRFVYADNGLDVAFGMAYVAYDLLNEQGQAVVAGITLADVRKFAAGETPDALQALNREQLDAARRLAQEPGMTF